ncbi:hypothetical protein GCM10009623_32700 [Nocardioides aestuarii]|uniref:Uncharacterized protein n=1 Tax=Nocardioides aestuarii TaxID=252231 RepID=A0ABW4TRP7_9ACTN
MTIDPDLDRSDQHSSAKGRLVPLAGLVAANLLVAFATLMVVLGRNDDELLVQEVWEPYALALSVQAAVNGLLLLMSERTRQAGLGVLLGTLFAVLAFLAWVWFGVLPNFA